jgi:hypothetical protein
VKEFENDIMFQMFVPEEDDYHGKLLFVYDDSKALLYIGSSNFTKAGYGDYQERIKNNIETGIVINTARSEGIDYLKVSLRKLLKGEWKKIRHPSKSNKRTDTDQLVRDMLIRQMIFRLRVNKKDILEFPREIIAKKKNYKVTEFILYNKGTSYSWDNSSKKRNRIIYQGWTAETSIQFRLKNGQFNLQFTAFVPPLVDTEQVSFKAPDKTILDLLDESPFSAQQSRKTRRRKNKCKSKEGNQNIDVRFPWHILDTLNEYSENHEWKKMQIGIIDNEINLINERNDEIEKIVKLEIARKVIENL